MDINSIRGKVFRALKGCGWTRDHDSTAIVEAFRSARGQNLFSEAEEFLRRFGGITVGGYLWVWTRPYEDDESVITLENRVSDTIGSRVVPVASANYLSSDSTVFIDEWGRFYVAYEGGMIFMAASVAKFFEIIILDRPAEQPPPELKERLLEARRWDLYPEE